MSKAGPRRPPVASSTMQQQQQQQQPQEEEDFLTIESGIGGRSVYKVSGSWDGRTAGGCLNHATWRWNQQIFVRSSETTTVKVKLTQHANPYYYIGFYVCKTDDTGKRQIQRAEDDFVARIGFRQSKEVWTEVKLEKDVEYIVIPCTYNPGECAKYTVAFTVLGDLSIHLLSPEDEWCTVELEGEWYKQTAGGCRNHPTFKNNPQYLLKTKEETKGKILLYRLKENKEKDEEEDDFDAIGFYLMKNRANARSADVTKKVTNFSAADLVLKSEFNGSSEADANFSLPGRGYYTLIPCSFDPGHESTFKLVVLSDRPVKLKEVEPAPRRLEAPKLVFMKPTAAETAPESDRSGGTESSAAEPVPDDWDEPKDLSAPGRGARTPSPSPRKDRDRADSFRVADGTYSDRPGKSPRVGLLSVVAAVQTGTIDESLRQMAESSREERRQARKIGLLNYMKTMGLLSDDLKNLEETIEVTADDQPAATPRPGDESSSVSQPESPSERSADGEKSRRDKREKRHHEKKETRRHRKRDSDDKSGRSETSEASLRSSQEISPEKQATISVTVTPPPPLPQATATVTVTPPKEKKEKDNDKDKEKKSPRGERKSSKEEKSPREEKKPQKEEKPAIDGAGNGAAGIRFKPIDPAILAEAVKLFNEKPKKGIELLIQKQQIEREPAAVARWLFTTQGLDKDKLGDYLGEGDKFNVEVLREFVKQFDFTHLDFDIALRQLLYSFRLPGEAQKIDRIVNSFASQYHRCNKNDGLFTSADPIYVLAFSTLMLHTDAHNPQVKKKMTEKEWLRNNRGINNGRDLPEDFLLDVYARITLDEIRMKADNTATFFPLASKKGFLQMKSKWWVKRFWFILDGPQLYWFKNVNDSSPVGSLCMRDCLVQKDEKKRLLFHLSQKAPPSQAVKIASGPLYSLLATSERDFNSWVLLLNKAATS